MRRRVPLPKIVPLGAMLSKLRLAKPQLIFAHVVHFVAPLTVVRRSAANDEAHLEDDKTMLRNVNVNRSTQLFFSSHHFSYQDETAGT